MRRSVFIGLCVIFFKIQSSVELSCGPNEIEDSCPSDCNDLCPTKPHQYRSCSIPTVCGTPKCKCRFNTKRAINGTCINTRECPPFKCDHPYEHFDPCPPYCPSDDCKQATPEGRCPLYGNILIVLECIPECRCTRGYWRTNGTCVPYHECPQQKTSIPIYYWK